MSRTSDSFVSGRQTVGRPRERPRPIRRGLFIHSGESDVRRASGPRRTGRPMKWKSTFTEFSTDAMAKAGIARWPIKRPPIIRARVAVIVQSMESSAYTWAYWEGWRSGDKKIRVADKLVSFILQAQLWYALISKSDRVVGITTYYTVGSVSHNLPEVISCGDSNKKGHK